MTPGYTIEIQGEGAVAEKLKQLNTLPAGMFEAMGKAGADAVKENFFRLDGSRANPMGGKRSHFYWEAAQATSYEPLSDGAAITVSGPRGIRQRWLGGTIVPLGHPFLAIPARAESYGVPPREFPGLLKFIPTQRGGMLVKDSPSTADQQKGDFMAGRNVRKKGRRLPTEGLVEYWLVPSVYQRPDPSVVPSPETMTNAAGAAASSYLERMN